MRDRSPEEGDLDSLKRRQHDAWSPGVAIADSRSAEEFLRRVGLALRYGPTPGLPLASLYEAFGAGADKASLTRAISLTNELLGKARAIETHVVADRVTLTHRLVVPALYALVRRDRDPSDLAELSLDARSAYALLKERGEISAGDLRRRLGLKIEARNDPAYSALGELTSRFLVDRGPFKVPKTGIPYLSREGYPYHFFHEAHPELVEGSRQLTPAGAAERFLEAYVRGAAFAAVGKMARLFRAFLSPAEIERALGQLARKKRLSLAGAGAKALAVAPPLRQR